MKIGVPKEIHAGEHRVALDPPSVKRLVDQGQQVFIESSAGEAAGFPDDAYQQVGGVIVADRAEVFQGEIVVQVRGAGACPGISDDEMRRYQAGQLAIGLWDPLVAPRILQQVAPSGVRCVSLELMPRITRAQSMDVLSSMATLAGYRAVIMAAHELPKIFPLMMTAAGTMLPAKVFVIGAGVAGLQAIATAKRLGAVVEGYDVRPAAREQVESVGGKFIEFDLDTKDAEGAGGYAQALGDDFYARQQAAMAQHVADADVIICTAAIPGKPSPLLITEDAVRGMRPGSVIVDLAAERGGNCGCTKPDDRNIVEGVTILGPTNAPADLPYHASQMFARNVLSFLQLVLRDGELILDENDEIVSETVITGGGQISHQRIKELLEESSS